MLMQQHMRNQALKVGLTVGLPLAALTAILTVLFDTGLLPDLVQPVEFLLVLSGCLLAGLRAGQQAGRALAGTLAGLLAGVLPGLVLSGAGVVAAAVAPATFARWYGWHGMTARQVLGAELVQSIVGLLLWAALGAAFGLVGGLFGSRRRGAQPT